MIFIFAFWFGIWKNAAPVADHLVKRYPVPSGLLIAAAFGGGVAVGFQDPFLSAGPAVLVGFGGVLMLYCVFSFIVFMFHLDAWVKRTGAALGGALAGRATYADNRIQTLHYHAAPAPGPAVPVALKKTYRTIYDAKRGWIVVAE